MLRLSGPNAIDIADAISKLPSGRLSKATSHTIHYGAITGDMGTHVDQVMLAVMRAPRTFTGEDVAEITCHNNQLIIEQIINLAIKHGARPAQRGEFARQAVLNNKMDIIQAESINELIHAQTQQAIRVSLSQVEGSLSKLTNKIEKQLLKALAHCEASFEFLDEEIEFADEINLLLTNAMETTNSAVESFKHQQKFRCGIRVAIVGAVNAGKSSLLNALTGADRAIVTPQAGTTRDTIEAVITINGNHITLVDTAGFRKTDDCIEQEGMDRSVREIELADIIVLLEDSADDATKQLEKLAKETNKPVIIAQSKSDLTPDGKPCSAEIKISSETGENIERLRKLISDQALSVLNKGTSTFLLTNRQATLLTALAKLLNTAYKNFLQNKEYELLSSDLKDALGRLTELTGKTVSDKCLDEIFREFCVGK